MPRSWLKVGSAGSSRVVNESDASGDMRLRTFEKWYAEAGRESIPAAGAGAGAARENPRVAAVRIDAAAVAWIEANMLVLL
jgi:hypothetical protein